MRTVITGLTFAALLGVAACAGNTSRPTDVGNMAYPTPARAGTLDPTTQSRDVGSMAQPTSTGGFAVRESPRPDTGNMALPPAAQGNSAPARITP